MNKSRASDNKHVGCPPRMSDGRLFTDYRSRCDVNSAREVQDSYAYRQHLIRNGTSIMEGYRMSAYASAQCGPCGRPPGTMLPEQCLDNCNTRTCARVSNDEDGIGLGRYQKSEVGLAKSVQSYIP
jgi:hypothetical protein